MRIEIEIPKEFESDYTGDKFKDFFSRVLCDIEEGVMCGNYEKEIANMFIEAFDKSKAAYNVEKVVAELEENGQKMSEAKAMRPYAKHSPSEHKYYKAISVKKAIAIVRNGGKE